VIGGSIFGRATAAARQLCRDWRVDGGLGSGVFGHVIGVPTQTIARALDLDDDGVVQ
jgi:hypothetical protein